MIKGLFAAVVLACGIGSSDVIPLQFPVFYHNSLSENWACFATISPGSTLEQGIADLVCAYPEGPVNTVYIYGVNHGDSPGEWSF